MPLPLKMAEPFSIFPEGKIHYRLWRCDFVSQNHREGHCPSPTMAFGIWIAKRSFITI